MSDRELSYEERERKRKEEIKTLFHELLGNHLNCCGREVLEVFSEEMHREHRTLQSNFWRMIQQLAENYAQRSDAYFDPRNATAKELCKEWSKTKIGLPLI